MAQAPQRFNRERLESWLARTDTRLFLQFLRDQRAKLADQWAAGQELDLRHQTKALLLGEFAELAWEDYAQFYDLAPEAAEDE